MGTDRGRLVVMVDDAHLLDTSSATLVGQLIDAEAVFLIATVRDGEAAPDAVASWWRDDRVVRVDLTDLDQAGTEAALSAVLGGIVARDTVARLHRASGGNPLLLRELVIGATDDGILGEGTGTWRLTGDVPPSRRLGDVLASRLAALGEDERHVLRTIAVCQPTAVAELAGVADEGAIEALEAAGFLRVIADGRRRQVLLAHPLYAEVLSGQLTVLGRQRMRREAADRVGALGARRREDARRVATWRLDAGEVPDRGVLLEAAQVARFANDFTQVARLAEVLHVAAPSTATAVLLGEAHYELGAFHASEAVLAGPLDWTDPSLAVQRALARAKNLQWGLSDWRRALEVVKEARRAAPVELAEDLRVGEASVLVFSGRPQAALDVLAGTPPGSRRLEVARALTASTALTMAGRPEEGVDVAVEGHRLHVTIADPQGLAHPGTHVINQVFALIEAGRLTEAEALARAGHEVSVADGVPIAQIWFALDLARSLGVRGRHPEALRWYHEASSTARAHGFDGPRRIALAGTAVSDAALGDRVGAAAAVSEAEALSAYGFLHHEQVAGWGWAAWVGGEPARARSLLVDGARRAADDGNVVAAGWLWHDAARLGAPDVAAPLAALADGARSVLLAARAAHVVALEGDDAVALDAVTTTFEDLGLDLFAAEAAWSGADAHRRAGRQRDGARLARRAEALAARVPGVRTPGLFRPDAPTPLTRREREIATLAGDGASSAEIAASLYLSVRTVDNHLQHAYAKLGVTARDQLAAALGPLDR